MLCWNFETTPKKTLPTSISDLIQVKKEEFYGQEEWWRFVKKKLNAREYRNRNERKAIQ